MKKQLYSLKIQKGSWLSDHLNELNRILTQLSNLEVKIEEDKALLFLSSLPPSFELLVTTLMYGKEILEMDEVTAALLLSKRMKTDSGKFQEDDLNIASCSN